MNEGASKARPCCSENSRGSIDRSNDRISLLRGGFIPKLKVDFDLPRPDDPRSLADKDSRRAQRSKTRASSTMQAGRHLDQGGMEEALGHRGGLGGGVFKPVLSQQAVRLSATHTHNPDRVRDPSTHIPHLFFIPSHYPPPQASRARRLRGAESSQASQGGDRP